MNRLIFKTLKIGIFHYVMYIGLLFLLIFLYVEKTFEYHSKEPVLVVYQGSKNEVYIDFIERLSLYYVVHQSYEETATMSMETTYEDIIGHIMLPRNFELSENNFFSTIDIVGLEDEKKELELKVRIFTVLQGLSKKELISDDEKKADYVIDYKDRDMNALHNDLIYSLAYILTTVGFIMITLVFRELQGEDIRYRFQLMQVSIKRIFIHSFICVFLSLIVVYYIARIVVIVFTQVRVEVFGEILHLINVMGFIACGLIFGGLLSCIIKKGYNLLLFYVCPIVGYILINFYLNNKIGNEYLTKIEVLNPIYWFYVSNTKIYVERVIDINLIKDIFVIYTFVVIYLLLFIISFKGVKIKNYGTMYNKEDLIP